MMISKTIEAMVSKLGIKFLTISTKMIMRGKRIDEAPNNHGVAMNQMTMMIE